MSWEEGVKVGNGPYGKVEVDLSHWRLTDKHFLNFCDWARKHLPVHGVCSRRSDEGRPPQKVLNLDLSDNSLGEESMHALAKLLVDQLRGVRVRSLKLHKNRLGPAAGEHVAQILQGLARRPREWRGYPEELHLSHNMLGREGLTKILEGVARSVTAEGEAVYPIRYSGLKKDSGPAKKELVARYMPLWLRMEYNQLAPRNAPEDMRAFVRSVEGGLLEIRRGLGLLPASSSPAAAPALQHAAPAPRVGVEQADAQSQSAQSEDAASSTAAAESLGELDDTTATASGEAPCLAAEDTAGEAGVSTEAPSTAAERDASDSNDVTSASTEAAAPAPTATSSRRPSRGPREEETKMLCVIGFKGNSQSRFCEPKHCCRQREWWPLAHVSAADSAGGGGRKPQYRQR